jgi:bifunctional non-homologous end joining protein LigD
MSDLFDKLDDTEREALVRRAMPKSVAPMKATLTHEPFSDDAWIYERKLDGVRALAFRDGRDVRLVSRNGKRLDDAFPEIVDVVRDATAHRIVADGEIVAFRGNVTSFPKLQKRIGLTDPDDARSSGVRVWLYLFDILHLDGRDTTALRLRARKRLLRSAFRWDDPLRYTSHRNGDGVRYLAEACRKGWEGIIAKKADSPYVHKRSRDWLKFKCTARQELVIGGFTDPKGSRYGFGALLVGYYDGNRLCYAGRVGTGFDDDLLRQLHARLQKRRRRTTPFSPAPKREKNVHWVEPDLVGEIGFTEWTDNGRLRHPRFLGLRTDKAARDVVREDQGLT